MNANKPDMLSECLTMVLNRYGDPKLLDYLLEIKSLTEAARTKEQIQAYFKEYPVSSKHLFVREFLKDNDYRHQVFDIMNSFGVYFKLERETDFTISAEVAADLLHLADNIKVSETGKFFEKHLAFIITSGKRVEFTTETFEQSFFCMGLKKTLGMTRNLDEVLTPEFIMNSKLHKITHQFFNNRGSELDDFVISYAERHCLDGALDRAKTAKTYKV